MMKVVVSAVSDKSLDDALAHAMAKASAYINNEHDVHITILELAQTGPDEYKASVEIHVIPITRKYHLDMENQFEELKHIHDEDYRLQRKEEDEHIRHIIYNHFSHSLGSYTVDIPQLYLSQINEINLENDELEKNFFKASHDIHEAPEVREALRKMGYRRRLDFDG